MKHPAPFSAPVLDLLDTLVEPGDSVLDPFAGTGRVHRLRAKSTVGVEIEWEWASAIVNPFGFRIQGNALHLPHPDSVFDCIVTSPCYGNRMADHHQAKDPSTRRSYTHDMRDMTGDNSRDLHRDNAGTLYFWDPRYKRLHEKAWAEAVRCLRPEGRFILNAKDCYRGQKRRGPKGNYTAQVRQHVVAWHLKTLCDLGLKIADRRDVVTAGYRHGENRHRVEDEQVIVLAPDTLTSPQVTLSAPS